MKNARLSLLSVLPLALTLTACINPVGMESIVETGFFGVAQTPKMGVNDDAGNHLSWGSLATVRGNVYAPTIVGTCSGGVKSVQLSVDGTVRQTSDCAQGRFSLPLTGTKAFAGNGSYLLQLQGNAPGGTPVILTKLYIINKVADPGALITFDSFPSSSIYDSEPFSGTCTEHLSVIVAGQTVSCNASGSFSQAVSLAMGAQTVTISWVDDYNNVGTRSYSITRNPPDAPQLTIGMVSAAPSAQVNLANITAGNPALSPILENASILGTRAGATAGMIPLSLAPSSGVTGMTLNVGNASYSFCKTQDESGVCIP